MGMSRNFSTSANSTISFEVLIDEFARVAQQRAVEVHVFACSQLHIETSAQLDERRDVAVDGARALRGLQHASDDLQHGGLARAVRAEERRTHRLCATVNDTPPEARGTP